MKQLKKLTRKGLEELAKEMPQVNVCQQRKLVGGEVFVNMWGQHEFSMGYNDNINVVWGGDVNWFMLNHATFSGGAFSLGVSITKDKDFIHRITNCNGEIETIPEYPIGADLFSAIDVLVPLAFNLVSGYAPALNPYNIEISNLEFGNYISIDQGGSIYINIQENVPLSLSGFINLIKVAESGYLNILNSGL